ncbi:ATP-binding protein, partial [bacterium]|nr:ATP-binding protein [bacterium]
IDGVPVIAIDPKGDLANLALGFPEMKASDLEPWVSEDEARLNGLTAAQLAEQSAAKWRQGLAQWQQTPERVKLMYGGAEVVIYTPGSKAGLPVSVLSSWRAPAPEILEDSEMFSELIQGAVSGLLSLLDIKFDPLSSREYLLLSGIFNKAWSEGRDLDLASLILQIQNPPFNKLGLFDLESLYPANDRFGLAMALNSLMVSPSFQNWMQGEPLDISGILYSPQGKPRVSVFSIAHLSDTERMFFVTMLSNAVLAWMRRQVGTSSLRALFYMDEVAGYLPPGANPPSKRPIMTLFKQARAFGLGMVMASQNPVDFDYKALSNAGVWLVGRLQTPQDRAKVQSSLEAALGNRASDSNLSDLLGGLAKRQFVAMVPGKVPFVFESRWTLSFLRGPMTRDDIKRVQPLIASRSGLNMAAAPCASGAGAADRSAFSAASDNAVPFVEPAPSVAASAPAAEAAPIASSAVIIPADIPQCWLEGSSKAVAYRPALLGMTSAHFANAKLNIAFSRTAVRVLFPDESAFSLDWEDGENLEVDQKSLRRSGDSDLESEAVPSVLCSSKLYKNWSRDLVTWVYRNEPLQLMSCQTLKAVSQAGESEREFRVRLNMLAREERDRRADAVRAKFEPKLQRVQERLTKAEYAKQNQEMQASTSKASQFLSIGSSLLSLFGGGRRRSVASAAASSAASAYKQYSRSQMQNQKAQQANERCKDIEEELQQLQAQYEEALSGIAEAMEAATEDLEMVEIAPKKSDVSVLFCGLGWIPVDKNGNIALC